MLSSQPIELTLQYCNEKEFQILTRPVSIAMTQKLKVLCNFHIIAKTVLCFLTTLFSKIMKRYHLIVSILSSLTCSSPRGEDKPG